MTKIINLFGGPGARKSTIAYGLAYHMKTAALDVELVTEYAKHLHWTNRLADMQDQQEYLFTKQNHILHALRGKVDFVVTDSPTFLSYVYSHYSKAPWQARDAFKAFVLASFNTYDNINIYLERPESYSHSGRSQSRQEAVELDELTKQALINNRIHYTTLENRDNDTTIEQIIDLFVE